jgi:rare lipoprotein A
LQCWNWRRESWNFYQERNEMPPPDLNARRTSGVPHVATCSCWISAAASGGAADGCISQSRTHGFSGLCAFYPAHGNGLTAAHRTLPFGTRVRVTDPKTGRAVTVTVNDRGPFGKHRVLDLSPSAARALGMISRGVIYVKAEVL